MNLTPLDIIETCSDIGLRIEPYYDRLLVVDERHNEPYIPESLFRLLVEHRDQIRDRLRAGHLSKQILYGEFSGASRSMRNAVAGELRSAPHPLARRALENLEVKR